MTDLLTGLYRSVSDLYARFGLTPTPDATARMFAEEAREFLQAADRLDTTRLLAEHDAETEMRPLDKATLRGIGDLSDNLSAEAADVLFTVVGVLVAAGIEADDFEAMLKLVIAKNDAKTRETYSVIGQKITRI